MKIGSEILYLSNADVERTGLGVRRVFEAVEAMFAAKAKGEAIMKPKLGLHAGESLFLSMVGGIAGINYAGMKWVGVASTRAHANQAHINGHVVLNDYTNGMPLAVMDARWITGARTAAISAVAAKRLARPDSASVGFVACGVQARANLAALRDLFPIARVRCSSRHRATAEAFAAEVRAQGLDARACDTAREAMEGMDIVVTSVPVVPKPEPVLDAAWLAPGSYAAIVDLGFPWKGDTLSALDCVVTDDLDQAVTEKLAYPKPYHGEVSGLVADKLEGRRRASDRTALIFAGLGLADVATAAAVYEAARAAGIGRTLAL